MARLATLERLMDAYDALLRCGDFMTCADPRGHIRATNRLFDAAVDCGMPIHEANPAAWAGERVTRFLMAA